VWIGLVGVSAAFGYAGSSAAAPRCDGRGDESRLPSRSGSSTFAPGQPDVALQLAGLRASWWTPGQPGSRRVSPRPESRGPAAEPGR
jgi:hypothetical protein